MCARFINYQYPRFEQLNSAWVFDVIILGWDSLAVFVWHTHTHRGGYENMLVCGIIVQQILPQEVFILYSGIPKFHHPKFHAEERGPALTVEVLKSMKEQQMEVNIFHVGAVIGACRSLAKAGSMDWQKMHGVGCASGQDWQLALSFLRGAMDDSLEAGDQVLQVAVVKSRVEWPRQQVHGKGQKWEIRHCKKCLGIIYVFKFQVQDSCWCHHFFCVRHRVAQIWGVS